MGVGEIHRLYSTMHTHASFWSCFAFLAQICLIRCCGGGADPGAKHARAENKDPLGEVGGVPLLSWAGQRRGAQIY